ncbi:Cytochrome-c oxidase [Bertholletia excelsa]
MAETDSAKNLTLSEQYFLDKEKKGDIGAIATEVQEKNCAKAEEESEAQEVEDAPAIKIETAPADFRFPTTNQTRHCFTRYVEYHRCLAAKGESAPECNKFAKYYRSLCPGEWIERWNEQRENGTFPGPV